jgi:hypothetical protein
MKQHFLCFGERFFAGAFLFLLTTAGVSNARKPFEGIAPV